MAQMHNLSFLDPSAISTVVPPGDNSTVFETSLLERSVELFLVVMVTVIGSANNILILILAVYSRHLRRRSHVLILNLAAADFLTTALFCPLYGWSLYSAEWPLQDYLCEPATVLLNLSAAVSLFTNFALAINRCVLARGHSWAQRATSTPVIVVGIVVMWISCFSLFCIPHVVRFLEVEYSVIYGYCIPSPNRTATMKWLLFYTYTWVIAVMGPVLGSVICYVCIVRSVKSSMFMTRSTQSRRRYIRSTRNMTYVFVAFCLCWLPDTIHFMADPNGSKIPPWASRVLFILFLANSVINPFIFAWKFPRVRQTLEELLGVHMHRRSSTMSRSRLDSFLRDRSVLKPVLPNPVTDNLVTTPLGTTSH